MHPAISINTLCLEPARFDRQVEIVARLGAKAISPTIEDIADFGPAEAARLLRDSGLVVATLTHRAFGYTTPEEIAEARDRLDRTLALAEAIGADSITMTTGGRGPFTWPEAVARFADAIAPCLTRARNSGVKLAVEPTSHLYADASIAHRLADLVTIGTQAGTSLGIDIFACWFDSDIDQAIADAAPIAAVVQLSDYVAGDRGLPCRAVPGDGMVPFDRLIPAIVAAGCHGPFDLEIIGPRIVAEGREAGLARAAAYIGALLEGAGLAT
ncbi:xylose isomerase [Nostoc sp. 3335mG]|nr:xylose isomerase [Nostoc sp. 3335mG]